MPANSVGQTELMKLTASDGAEDDHFGISVAVSGDTALAHVTSRGECYVLQRNGTQWEQVARLEIDFENLVATGFLRMAPDGKKLLVYSGGKTGFIESKAGQKLDKAVVSRPMNVVIQPPVALVQIDQSFYNPYGRQQEGTFVFNLPRGASVSRASP